MSESFINVYNAATQVNCMGGNASKAMECDANRKLGNQLTVKHSGILKFALSPLQRAAINIQSTRLSKTEFI